MEHESERMNTQIIPKLRELQYLVGCHVIFIPKLLANWKKLPTWQLDKHCCSHRRAVWQAMQLHAASAKSSLIMNTSCMPQSFSMKKGGKYHQIIWRKLWGPGGLKYPGKMGGSCFSLLIISFQPFGITAHILVFKILSWPVLAVPDGPKALWLIEPPWSWSRSRPMTSRSCYQHWELQELSTSQLSMWSST